MDPDTLSRHRAPECQHFLLGTRSEGDAIRDGRRLQRSQRARLVAVDVVLGEVGLPHVFHQNTPAREQLRQPGDERLQRSVQLVVCGHGHLDEGRYAVATNPVHAVQHQAVLVDVEIGGRAKALY